ncbi:hypothetical protein VSS37_11625 [Candidatus Thiothrix sp. Deng01]|uniref:Uncharacterized protein n=1 Tax=Candidatus Thiothrix phosphatis TaxID=3112415 RepID=A0ABU6CXS0_9GAMM|nr:hypothetical protein [Candidatus Thiothrix sp. Deng01]MEB4591631.1 hypothetical protein [Candidatus Thiothrix sp. Deng01]
MPGEVDLDQSASSLTDEKNQLESDIFALEAQLSSGRQPDLDSRLAQLKGRLSEINSMETQIAAERKSRLGNLLGSLRTQRAFSTVRDIKENLDSLNTARGQEGTITVAAGAEGVALLRSKKPLFVLLDAVAEALGGLCASGGAVLLTAAEREQAQSARFVSRRLTELNDRLKKLTGATPRATPDLSATRGGPPTLAPSVVPTAVSSVFAGAQLLGLSLDTLNGLAKMLRTDRELGVFDSGAEALTLLGYLLESKGKVVVADSVAGGQVLLDEAFVLLEQLGVLQGLVAAGKAMPEEGAGGLLKSSLESANSLLAALNPASQPDAFWGQVKGQALANALNDRERLFVELKAQTVQVTEKKWYKSQSIYATGELQVAYRLFKPDDSLKTSGVILKASRIDAAQISKLSAAEWVSPTA